MPGDSSSKPSGRVSIRHSNALKLPMLCISCGASQHSVSCCAAEVVPLQLPTYRDVATPVTESPRSEPQLFQKLSRMCAVTGLRAIVAAQRSAICAASQRSARPSGTAMLVLPHASLEGAVSCGHITLLFSVRHCILLFTECCQSEQKLLGVQAFIPGPLQASEGGALQPPVRRPVSIQDPSDGSQPVSSLLLMQAHILCFCRAASLISHRFCMPSAAQLAQTLLVPLLIYSSLSSILCITGQAMYSLPVRSGKGTSAWHCLGLIIADVMPLISIRTLPAGCVHSILARNPEGCKTAPESLLHAQMAAGSGGRGRGSRRYTAAGGVAAN